MEPSEPSVYPPSLSICLPQAGNPCSRTVTGSHCWLLCCLDLRNGHHYSHSRHCPLNPAQEPSVHNLFSFPAFCPAEFHSNHIDMVLHRMRSRRGGTCSGSARPQAAQSSVPASLPHPHENSPPPSSPHRHYPQTRSGRGQVQASMAAHSDFRLHTTISPLQPSSVPHSTQFRFQSSLNRPIITANVTIVFSEESEQHSAQMRNFEAQFQKERSQGVGLGFEKRPKDECRGVRHGRLHEEGDHAGDIQQIGGSSTEASITMALAGSSSSTQHVREPPGGAAKGDAAEADEDWGQYACFIIEETPDQDDNK